MHESGSWRLGHVSIEMAWGSEGSWVEKDCDDCNKNHEERGKWAWQQKRKAGVRGQVAMEVNENVAMIRIGP